MHLQRAGDNDDRDKRQQFLELGQKIQTQFALRQHVVKDEQIRRLTGNVGQRLGASLDTDQRVFVQGLLVNLELEIVVFDNKNNGLGHGSSSGAGRTFGMAGRNKLKTLPWPTVDSRANPASIFLANS